MDGGNQDRSLSPTLSYSLGEFDEEENVNAENHDTASNASTETYNSAKRTWIERQDSGQPVENGGSGINFNIDFILDSHTRPHAKKIKLESNSSSPRARVTKPPLDAQKGRCMLHPSTAGTCNSQEPSSSLQSKVISDSSQTPSTGSKGNHCEQSALKISHGLNEYRDATAIIINDDVLDLDSQDSDAIQNESLGGEKTQVPLQKFHSVQQDANQIAEILGLPEDDEIEIIYAKVKERRQLPNRLDLVMNDILEGNVQVQKKTVHQESSQSIIDDVSNILEDINKVTGLLHQKDPQKQVDPNEIYELLEINAHNTNRVEIVCKHFLNSSNDVVIIQDNEEETDEHSGMLKDVEKIGKQVSGTDPNTIFTMLEERKDNENRVQIIIEKLKSTKAETETTASVDEEEEGVLAADPIFRDTVAISKLFPRRDKNEIYAYLEANHDKVNRVQIVTNELLGLEDPDEDNKTPQGSGTDSSNPFLQGPGGLEPGHKWSTLEEDNKTPQGSVTNSNPFLQGPGGLEPGHKWSTLENNDKDNRTPQGSGTNSNPFLQGPGGLEPGHKWSTDKNPIEEKLKSDTESIQAILPDSTTEWVRAELVKRTFQVERVQELAMEMFTTMENPYKDNKTPQGSGTNSNPFLQGPGELKPGHKWSTDKNPIEEKLKSDTESIQAILPDSDTEWVRAELVKRTFQVERVQELAMEMFTKRNFPKGSEIKKKRQIVQRRTELQNLQLNVEEFLALFPDPVETFYNDKKPVGNSYKTHVLIHLLNSFPMVRKGYILTVLDAHSGHLVPSLRVLEDQTKELFTDRVHASKLRRHIRDFEEFPTNPDERFYRELAFTRQEKTITEAIEKRKKEKEERIKIAKEKGELMECLCCYDDEVIIEDMNTCAEGHCFCKGCIKRSSEEVIGQGRLKFPCLSADCEGDIPMSVLQSVLPANVFSSVVRKIQEEEIKQADIPDLISCPFCPFATIMPNPEDKVFKCLSPECLKESCRFCKEPNHIPLRCEEVEKQGETNMRTYIENRISQAMIRTCHQCKKNFFKTEGCNKMTCACGAHMCYVCRQPINDGYGHFGDRPGQCPQETDVSALHRNEMMKAGVAAEKEFKKDNPQVSNLQLKNDPLKEFHKDLQRRQSRDMLRPLEEAWEDDDEDDVEDDVDRLNAMHNRDIWGLYQVDHFPRNVPHYPHQHQQQPAFQFGNNPQVQIFDPRARPPPRLAYQPADINPQVPNNATHEYPDSDDDELDEIERLRKAGPWQAPLHNRLRELLQERQNRRKKRLDIKL